jgi:predicted tellurium resistance membrane protein TerC
MDGDILIMLIVLVVGVWLFTSGAAEISNAFQENSPLVVLVGLVVLFVGWQLIRSSTAKIT